MSKATGLCKAKGGSMHLTKAAAGMLGSYAIVGAHLPIAVGRPGRPGCVARARSPSPSSVTARPTSAPSTRRSIWPRYGDCRWCSCARTTCTWSTRRSPRSPPRRTPRRTGPRRTGCRPASSTATTSRSSTPRCSTPYDAPGQATGRRWSRPRPTGTSAQPHRPGHVPAGRRGRGVAGSGPVARTRPGSPPSGSARTELRRVDERGSGQSWTRYEAEGARCRSGRGADGRVGRRGLGMADVITYREAVAEGIAREMRRDPTVVCLGEDIGAAEGVFKTTTGLFKEFGRERVWDTPISEQAIVGRRAGRRHDRAASRRRDHVLGLPGLLLGLRGQRDPEGALHDRRSGRPCRWSSAPRTAAGSASARSTRRPSRTGCSTVPGMKIAPPARRRTSSA